MPDYLVAYYDSGKTIGRLGRGLQVRLPALFQDVNSTPDIAAASPKAAKNLHYPASCIASRHRVDACCDGACIGRQSMCAIQ